MTYEQLEALREKATKGECIEWTGTLDDGGYGRLEALGQRKAHRVAWILENGPIPRGKFVLHRCDNRKCVNPLHLWLGSKTDNNLDRDKKGRTAKGVGHWKAKLTEAAVLEIRSLVTRGVKQSEIAAKFGVDERTVSAINTRVLWRHLP